MLRWEEISKWQEEYRALNREVERNARRDKSAYIDRKC